MPDRSNTRAAQGSGTIRQRKDGRWEARYTIGRDPGTGRQLQRSVYGTTQKDVLQKLQHVQVSITKGTYIEPSRTTVGKWLDIWLAEYNKEIKARSLALYKGQIDYRIKPALGAVKLSALRPHDIQAFLNQQGQDAKGKSALSPKSIKNLHGILHKALSQAVTNGYIKTNPSNACKLPRIEKKSIEPLNNEQISAFLQAIKGHPFEMVYTFTLFTGTRQGEALGLTWDCVDFQNGTIHIYRQLQRTEGVYRFVTLKNDKARTLTPASAVLQLLRDHRRLQEDSRLLAGDLWEDANFVFTNEFGRHLMRETVYRHYKRIVGTLGIPAARFHDLRHSYAVAALQSGDDVKTVQENLGHHTAAFTLDVYGHVTEKMKQESAARMDKFIRHVSEP